MKFIVTMKDPDCAFQEIAEEAKRSVDAVEGLSEEEKEILAEKRGDVLKRFVHQWLEYGEYVRIEFDTEAQTATILRVEK